MQNTAMLYAQMQQRAASLFEKHYNNALFCNYYDDEDLLAFAQQRDKKLHNYMQALEGELYTHFVNVLFAVLRYNARVATSD